MPPIKSLISKHYACIIALILLLSKIIPSCSCYIEKKLVYVTIVAPSSHQPFFYFKYTKSNIHLSCNIKSVLDTKYASYIRLIIL